MQTTNQWLSQHVPGFLALSENERNAIFSFTLLWSFFEARILDNNAQADRIRRKVDEWHNAGTLDVGDFDDALAYFRQRYFADGNFTHHFPHLLLRNSDQPDIVKSVLNGSNGDMRDGLLSVLMIVWRFRNNLFHGAKWFHQLEDQLTNFTHANAVLMRLLARHGQLMS